THMHTPARPPHTLTHTHTHTHTHSSTRHSSTSTDTLDQSCKTQTQTQTHTHTHTHTHTQQLFWYFSMTYCKGILHLTLKWLPHRFLQRLCNPVRPAIPT